MRPGNRAVQLQQHRVHRFPPVGVHRPVIQHFLLPFGQRQHLQNLLAPFRIVENNWTDRIIRYAPPDVLLQPDLHDIFMLRLRHVTRAILRGKLAAEKMISELSPEMKDKLGVRS